MNKNVLKIVGIVGIVGGCVALYFAGVGENEVVGIVAGVFVLVGVIAALFASADII